MPELQDSETVEIKGSAAKSYILRNTGGVHSCSCPAWRNQSLPIDRRSCKHLVQFRGQLAAADRIAQRITTIAVAIWIISAMS